MALGLFGIPRHGNATAPPDDAAGSVTAATVFLVRAVGIEAVTQLNADVLAKQWQIVGLTQLIISTSGVGETPKIVATAVQNILQQILTRSEINAQAIDEYLDFYILCGTYL